MNNPDKFHKGLITELQNYSVKTDVNEILAGYHQIYRFILDLNYPERNRLDTLFICIDIKQFLCEEGIVKSELDILNLLKLGYFNFPSKQHFFKEKITTLYYDKYQNRKRLISDMVSGNQIIDFFSKEEIQSVHHLILFKRMVSDLIKFEDDNLTLLNEKFPLFPLTD